MNSLTRMLNLSGSTDLMASNIKPSLMPRQIPKILWRIIY